MKGQVVTFSDFAAFVIATSFLVAVFVAPYIVGWHYMHPPAHRASYHPLGAMAPLEIPDKMPAGGSSDDARRSPGSLDAIEAGRGLAFGDGAARWLPTVIAVAGDHTVRSRDTGAGAHRSASRDKADGPSPRHLQTLAGVPPQFLSPLLAASHLCVVDAPLLASLVQRESEWRADAVSPAGAIGLGQLMPRTAKAMRVDPWNPAQNLIGAACHLRAMLDRYKGDERRALIAYHRGAWAKGPTPQASHDYASDIITGSAQ